MTELFSHLMPAQQSGVPDQGDDPLPDIGTDTDTWSPTGNAATPIEGASAPKAAESEKKGPSLGHTAGMTATDFLLRGAPMVLTAPIDAGIATANTIGWGKNKVSNLIGEGVNSGFNAITGQNKTYVPEQFSPAPYITPAWNNMLTEAGVPVPESTLEEWIHPAAVGAGGALGMVENAGSKAMNATLGMLSGAIGGETSKVGGIGGRMAGAAAQQMLPEGTTIAGYTPTEAGEFAGSMGGGIAGGAGAAYVLPKASKAGIDALLQNNIPVSMGQVRGGLPGQVESGLARTNILGMPSRNLGGQQDVAIDKFLHSNGGHMSLDDAGTHIQTMTEDALQSIKDARSAIYKPYMDQIGDPQFYKNGKPMIGKDGQPLVVYPKLQPTTSIKLAKGLAQKFKGNQQAQNNAGISQIQEVVDLLSKPMDINEAKQQIGFIRDKAHDLSNPMFQGNNRQLGSHLTRITKALQNDIAESAELAKPGARALLKEADAKAAPTYDEEYALKPLVNVPKNESAAVRFVQATGAGKAIGNAELVKSLYKYSDPAMADKLSAYLVKTLGQSDSHPSSTGLAPQLNSSAASSGVNNIKANNPDVHSLLFPQGPGKQINSEFIQGLNAVGKTPLNQGIPHMGAVGAGGAGAGIIGAAEHVMEHGLTGLIPEPHTLALMAAGAGTTNAASKISTLQSLVGAYNQLPRADQAMLMQMMRAGATGGYGTQSSQPDVGQAAAAASMAPQTNTNMFQDLIPEGNQ